MSSLKNIVKEGWHPEGKKGSRDTSKSSTWRKDYKGLNQVAGWMGKGETSSDTKGDNYAARPLSTLKDPSAFGPPPKNVNYHGGAALPNEITPARGGLGAPLTQAQIERARQIAEPEPEEIEPEKPAAPSLPFRADRTGLKTDHLPPPPVRRNDQSPIADSSQHSVSRPGVPPRLPSRQNTQIAELDATPAIHPPTYDPVAQEAMSPTSPTRTAYVNQAALDRLTKAKVHVPALGIGSEDSNPWNSEQSHGQSAESPTDYQSQPAVQSVPVVKPPTLRQQAVNQTPAPAMSELQARFSRLNANNTQASEQQQSATSAPLVPTNSHPKPPPAQGTTWEQKQAAFRTAQNFHRDPSTVTLADARSAATTANNFRERHQESINAGARQANTWNKKYNIAGKVSTFLEQQTSPQRTNPPMLPVHPNAQQQSPITSPTAQISSPPLGASQPPDLAKSIARKAPPPPPPKKPGVLHGNPNPPPIPTGTRPNMP